MIYIVRINYTDFEFMNGTTALTFAELALGSAVGEADISIELKAVPVEQKEREDDDF